MTRTRKHGASVVSMLLGGCCVLAFIVLMNEHTQPPPPAEKEAARQLKVEKKPKKKKAPRPQRQAKRTTRSTSKPAPIPDLSSGISSVALAMPGFDASSLGDAAAGVLGDTKKNLVMDEHSVDEAPKAVSRTPASYPAKARAKGVTGYVKVSMLIDEAGDVQRVKVLDAQPTGVFEDSAVAALRSWRFKPAVYQAEHVRAWATQTVRFELN